MSINFSRNTGEDSVQGSDHELNVIQVIINKLGFFLVDPVVKISNFGIDIVSFVGGDCNIGSCSLNLDFKVIDCISKSVSIISQVSDGLLKLSDTIPGIRNFPVIIGNDSLAVSDASCQCFLSGFSISELLFQRSDDGFGFSELQPVIGNSVSFIIIGSGKDADFLFESSDLGLIGSNLDLNIVELTVEVSEPVDKVLDFISEFIKP